VIRLVPQTSVGRLEDLVEEPSLAFAREMLEMSREFYARIGATAPWFGYFTVDGERAVGVCGFKGNPVDGVVEISYGTFAAYEGRGYASAVAAALTRLALDTDPSLTVIAHTLPEENASVRILRRNGFRFAGEVMDPEDGRVWRWEYAG